MGTKAKAALTELESINFDETLFTDAMFLTLEDFTQPIIPTPIGREYPFSLTGELRTMSKKSRPNLTSTSKPVPGTVIIKIPAGAVNSLVK